MGVQEQGVAFCRGVGGGAGGGGVGAEVGLGEGDGEGGVGGEVEVGVAFAPISVEGRESVRNAWLKVAWGHIYLITAMLTGAVVLARYILLSAIAGLDIQLMQYV